MKKQEEVPTGIGEPEPKPGGSNSKVKKKRKKSDEHYKVETEPQRKVGNRRKHHKTYHRNTYSNTYRCFKKFINIDKGKMEAQTNKKGPMLLLHEIIQNKLDQSDLIDLF